MKKLCILLTVLTFILLPLTVMAAPAESDGIWGPWIVDKQPTCTQAGQEHRVATQGNGAVQHADIPALGHNYVAAVTKQPTCTEAGVKTYTCTRCGDTYTEPIPALGHDFGPWAVETPARPGVPGVEIRVCQRCGEKETREIAALPVVPAAPTVSATAPVSTPTPTKAGYPNTADIIIDGTGLALIVVFTALLVPYIRGMMYIRKRRKIVKEMQDIKEKAAKKYDFK
jgi:hypothetical protein